MKNLLSPISKTSRRLSLGVTALAFWLLVPSDLPAQTNFNFNDGNTAILPPDSAPYPGWENWLPEVYQAENPVSGEFTNAIEMPSVTFVTNNSSAGNLALLLRAGTTNSSLFNPPKVASYFTNGPSLADFTMAVDFFNFTNGQANEFGLAGRVALPLPLNNAPGVESYTNSDAPNSIILVYANARSAKYYYSPQQSGSSDNMRMYWVSPGNTQGRLSSESFSGPGANYAAGTSLSPNTTNGNYYRFLFTASGLNLTAQMIDLSTGLPMKFGGGTNMMRTLAYYTSSNANSGLKYEYYLTNNGAIYLNGVLTGNTVSLGGASGVIDILGSSGQSAPVPGNPTVGSALTTKFDNFAIVPGVVTLESAAVVTGPYSQNTAAGIDLYNKRITIPITADSAKFYRINWIGGTYVPTITSITSGPTVNQVLASGPTTTVTNAVQTMILTYN